MEYKTKYLKYKIKYLDLKKLSGGSSSDNHVTVIYAITGKEFTIKMDHNEEDYNIIREKISYKLSEPIHMIYLYSDNMDPIVDNKIYASSTIRLILCKKFPSIAASMYFIAAIAINKTDIIWWSSDTTEVTIISNNLLETERTETYTMISASTHHVAVITTLGNAYCFSIYGAGDSITNVPILIDDWYVMISAGHGFTAAITTNNNLVYWGENIEKINLKIDAKYKYVYAGNNYIAAIDTDGNITHYDLLTGEVKTFLPSNPIFMISGSNYFIIAITLSGKIEIFEIKPNQMYNFGRLIEGDTNVFSYISISDKNLIGLTTSGTLKIWGDTMMRFTFEVSQNETITEVSCGPDYFSVAKTSNERVLGWGDAHFRLPFKRPFFIDIKR